MRTLIALSLCTVLGCTLSLTVEASLYTRPTRFRTVTAPPPLQADTERADKPAADAVWVSGHWRWDAAWIWVGGSWKQPRPGYVWEPPVCVADEGEYRYYDGYFRPEDEPPSEEYREPGQIQVHVPDTTIATSVPTRVVVVPGHPVPTQTLRVERPDTRPGTTTPTTAPTQDPQIDPAVEGPQNRPTLTCRLTIARVPRNPGNFVIEGAGLGDDVEVFVAGSVQSVRSATASQIQAQTSSAGTVTVRRGQNEADCGRLELF